MQLISLNYWQNFLKTPTKKRLIENFISLSILQAFNYILPLITLPYLVRVVGPEKFGLISFAQAFIGYFVVFTDYGFNLSATREISINRDNREKIFEIFSSVMLIRFCLMIMSLLIISIIIFSFKKFRQDWLIYYLTFGMILGNVLFPVWFFQGMEKMKYITVLNIIAKLIFTIAIFVFVKKTADYIYVPLINSFGFIISGFLALWIVFNNFKIKLKLPLVDSIKHQLEKGWHIFLANIMGNIYGQGTTFILGLLSTYTIVGYYSAAERFMKIIANLSQPFAQSIYPYITQLHIKNKEIFRSNFRVIITISIILSLFVSLLSYINAFFIINFIYGDRMLNSVPLFKFLTIVMFFTILNVIKQPYIFALNIDKLNSIMYMVVSFTFIPICFMLSIFYSALGTSISLLYVEIMIFLIGIYIIIKEIKK